MFFFGSSTIVFRFGESLKIAINDQTRYKMYNRVGLVYENVTLGRFQFLQMIFSLIIIITR
jgi:hypothetical protein